MSRTSSPGCNPSCVALANLRTLSLAAFHQAFGSADFARAISGFTPAADTAVVLTLLAHARPLRILEIGTAAGHMTANLTEWAPEHAHIFSLGTIRDLNIATSPDQRPEDPTRATFARHANHFGKASKVLFITADSLAYDFAWLALLDFVFIDGAHDEAHVLSDSLKAYDVLRPEGFLVWHDFNSRTPWVQVRQALAKASFTEPLYHVAGTEVAFLRKHEVFATPLPPLDHTPFTEGSPTPTTGSHAPLALVWEGLQKRIHSLALVNRAFCLGLMQRGHELCIVPEDAPAGEESLSPVLVQHFHRPLPRAVDVTIRQAWPTDFTPPAQGHWVVMQPWEYGSLPVAWTRSLSDAVDEVWANSRYVHDVYVQSGVPADRVHVVPLGVDLATFHPDARPFPLKTSKRFKFLFVGGTLFRKGIDILLDVYARAFRRHDDVCLVIKDIGVGTYYQGQTAEARIADLQAQANAPEIEYYHQTLTAEVMAGLYCACDCLVHPYRGEGFGLPIAEAMACGLPAIVTGMGAALDFCSGANAFLIPAQRKYFTRKQLDGMETVDYPWLAEPNPKALHDLLQYALAHPNELRAKGQLASAHIRAHFSWDHAVAAAEQRLFALRQRPIRRHSPPTPCSALSPPRPGANVSLCMIVKNAEATLDPCLRSVADLVGQMIVVDTGSTDRSRQIAHACGAQVVDFSWVDSFAAARNESLRHATGEWILWLDADESFDATNRERLRQLFGHLPAGNVVFLMCQHSQLEQGPHAVALVDHPRLFRNHPLLRWRYRVHEQILPSLRQLGAHLHKTDIVITHAGFADPTAQQPKVQRNQRLLEMELQENPTDPFVLYNLGAVALTAGRLAEALDLLKRSLQYAHPGDTLLPKLHALVVRTHHQLGQKEEARAVCRAARAHPGLAADAELLFWEGVLCRELDEPAAAEACWLQVLQAKPAEHFTCMDAGLKGFRTRHFLALLYRDQGEATKAETQWQQAVIECPGFAEAWFHLAALYLEQARWPQFDTACVHLQAIGHARDDADLLRARACLVRHEFGRARSLLDALIARAPQAVGPRVLLSHLLLQEGSDPTAAERAIRDVLALDPAHQEARHNLDILLNQQRPPADRSPVESAAIQPTAIVLSSDRLATPRVSLCMIVKNEAPRLETCLASLQDLLQDLVDEIIVVDTGSTDGTKDVAVRHGAHVHDFTWHGDFAAARNEGLRHATGAWIFWLDADEYVNEANRSKLRRVVTELNGPAAYVMKQHSFLPSGSAIVVNQIRLFPRHPTVRWEHSVHEQVIASVQRLGIKLRWTDVAIEHTGYRDQETFTAKRQRNLTLLERDWAAFPNQLHTLYYRGIALLDLGRPADALTLFHRCLQDGQAGSSTGRMVHALLAQCYVRLGKPDEALAMCQAGRAQFPDDPGLLFQEARLQTERGELAAAERCLLRLLASKDDEHFTTMDAGVRDYKARHQLATVYLKQGQTKEAEAQWHIALKICSDFAPAWLGLGELYLAQKRWADLEGAAKQLQAQKRGPEQAVQADLLRTRGHLARRKWTAARHCAQRAISRAPQALPARVLLCQALLQEGKDWTAAERALREVLALDPMHKEARHDLAQLLHAQGRAAEMLSPLPVLSPPVPKDAAVATARLPAPARARVSLCMIVRNEEANLAACLASVASLVDEIILVDTGSTDRTKEIASHYQARVFDFPWVDSFAAARNESLRHATGEWVFWLDADDRVDAENRAKLRALFTQLPVDGIAAYVMKCVCLPDPIHQTTTVVDHVRLFPNHPQLRWSHRVHEQILPAVRRLSGEVRLTDIRIQHVGYQDPPLRHRKLERDLRLLRLEEAEQPEHPFTLFNLGCHHQQLQETEQAISYFQRSLDHSQPADSIVRKLYALLAQCHRHLGRKTEALAACQQGRALYPEDAELLFREGLVRIDLGDLPGAAKNLEQLLALPPAAYLASMDTGIRGHLAHFNLAEVYRAQGRLAEAERQLQATLEQQRHYLPALHALAELYLRQERWPEFEPIAARLDALPSANEEVAVLRARAHLLRKEFAPARALLEAAITRFPQALRPHVILSHVLLREGQDGVAAEKALRAVLALDPEHVEARRNLALLLERQSQGLDFAPPVGDELASLIILCCDQLDCTRACLESVLAHTRAPYELIVVDNGSRDGTAAYLESFQARPGPARVVILRNATNEGFGRGCNQGMAAACGRYLVLLNNDTIVTPTWLDRLVACVLSDWPEVGLVGPVTSYAPPPQLIPVDYHDTAGLASFAARRRSEYAGQALRVERLTGFCLLIRREVLDRIGMFDERFGLGFFEDDDLCFRARDAGFGLRVALDVFVHHDGSRTFRSLGIDYVAKLHENFARFQEKWGPDRTAAYSLPENPAAGDLPTG